MPTLARAHLLTFRTYGTWLPGDGRFSMGRSRAHGHGAPAITPSAALRRESLDAMKGDAVVLDAGARVVVNATIGEVCSHRGWGLLAVNARTNHVHVVLSAVSCSPEEAMTTLKAWCTRRLREAGRAGAEARVWARHGSTRYLWTEKEVEGAVRYVVEGQG